MIERIHDRSTFRGFGRGAARSTSGRLTIVRGTVHTGNGVAFAYAIPRSVGSAVVRNRLRRQLRVAVADLVGSGKFTPGAYLVVVRPGAGGTDMTTLRDWLATATSGLPSVSDK